MYQLRTFLQDNDFILYYIAIWKLSERSLIIFFGRSRHWLLNLRLLTQVEMNGSPVTFLRSWIWIWNVCHKYVSFLIHFILTHSLLSQQCDDYSYRFCSLSWSRFEKLDNNRTINRTKWTWVSSIRSQQEVVNTLEQLTWMWTSQQGHAGTVK